MENRYRLMSSLNVKNNKLNYLIKYMLTSFSGRKLYEKRKLGIDKEQECIIIEKKEISLEKMQIVVINDEMAV